MTATSGARRAHPGPTRRPRPTRTVLALVLALVLVVAVGGGLLLLGGDDEPTIADGPRPSADGTASEETGPDPLDDPLSPESIDLRYGGLAEAVTTGTDSCRSVKARRGQSERLLCDASVGRLELVSYATVAALADRRGRAVTYEPGGVLDAGPTGTLMAFEASEGTKGAKGGKGAKGVKGTAAASTYLYWDDDQARQSATYSSDAGTEIEPLVEAYDATGPVRPYPTGPSSRKLVRFARRWVEPDACLRTETVNEGALEESYCDVDGPVEVFLGRFGSLAQLKAYRTIVVASAVADDRDVRDWSRPSGGDPVGALYEYTTDAGTVSRYWDDPSCLCYAEASWKKGSYAQLARWWDR